MSNGEPSRSRCAASKEPEWLPRKPSRPGGLISVDEASAACVRAHSMPAAPATAIAMPFTKSRRVIPVLIERYWQYGAIFAIRDPPVIGRWCVLEPGAMLATQGGCSSEKGGWRISRPKASPEGVVGLRRRADRRHGVRSAMGRRYGPRGLPAGREGDGDGDGDRRAHGNHGRGAR